MPRGRNPKVDQAEALFLKGKKLIDISNQLELPEGTVRRWKSTYKWGSERSDKKANVRNKGGAPKGNKNAIGEGAPSENKNAEKHGFFSKWLPAETAEIMQAIEKAEPLDIMWDNIQLQYTAIIRAQKLMYVKDQQDVTTTISSEKWEVQKAWDKHAIFLNAQSRAMKTLESMMKQYDELLHKNWELATEEQKQRIENLKANTAKLKGDDPDETKEDDGFIDALKGGATEIWQEEKRRYSNSNLSVKNKNKS